MSDGQAKARAAAFRVFRRLRRSLRATYYAWGYGRQFPLHERAAARIRAWELQDGRGDVPLAQSDWDQQYAAHGWDFLSGIGELAHYAVVSAYGAYLRPNAAVLDLGCGTGVLHERYLPLGYERYVGVDISQVAVAHLTDQAFAHAEFVAHDAETYEPNREFDVIIFNESITYFARPEAGFDRYSKWLAEDGVMIVSCHIQSGRAQAILRTLKARHQVIDETVVQQSSASWRVTVLRPVSR